MTTNLDIMTYTPEILAELNDGQVVAALDITSQRMKALEDERSKALLWGGVLTFPAWVGAAVSVDYVANSAERKAEAEQLLQASQNGDALVLNAGESAVYDHVSNTCFAQITDQYYVEEKTDSETGEVIEGHVGAPMTEVAQTYSTCIQQELNDAANPNYVADLALPAALFVTACAASAMNFYHYLSSRKPLNESRIEAATVRAEVSRRAEAQFGHLQP